MTSRNYRSTAWLVLAFAAIASILALIGAPKYRVFEITSQVQVKPLVGTKLACVTKDITKQPILGELEPRGRGKITLIPLSNKQKASYRTTLDKRFKRLSSTFAATLDPIKKEKISLKLQQINQSLLVLDQGCLAIEPTPQPQATAAPTQAPSEAEDTGRNETSPVDNKAPATLPPLSQSPNPKSPTRDIPTGDMPKTDLGPIRPTVTARTPTPKPQPTSLAEKYSVSVTKVIRDLDSEPPATDEVSRCDGKDNDGDAFIDEGCFKCGLSRIKGDLDNDGKVTRYDSYGPMLIFGKKTTVANPAGCDVDQDGVVGLMDMVAVLKIIDSQGSAK